MAPPRHRIRWRTAIWMYLFTAAIATGGGAGGGEEASGVYLSAEPADAWARAGAAVTLACAARVVPAAPLELRYSWRFAAHAQAEPAELLLAEGDADRRQLANGSLWVSVSARTAGRYRCAAAADGAGRVVSRVAVLALAELGALDAAATARRVTAAWRGAAVLLPCAAAEARHRVLGAAAGADRRVYGAPQHAQPANVLDVNVTWYKDGAPLPSGDPRYSLTPSGALELEPAREHDAGVYRCVVALAGPAAQAAPASERRGPELELQVAEEPSAADLAPRFIASPRSVTVLEGTSVTLDCAAVGEPRPEMVWLNNGVAIDLNDLDSRFFVVGAGSLRVVSARALDAGAYTCRAANRHDAADVTATLSVLAPPRVARVRPVVRARVAADVLLPCEARGRPPPVVTWYKDGEPITINHDISLVNGHSLRIAGALLVDAGMLQCVASSAAGSAQAATRLLVHPDARSKSGHKPNSSEARELFHSLVSSKGSEVPFTLRDINRRRPAARDHAGAAGHAGQAAHKSHARHALTSLLSRPASDENADRLQTDPDFDGDGDTDETETYIDNDETNGDEIETDFDDKANPLEAASAYTPKPVDVDSNLLTTGDVEGGAADAGPVARPSGLRALLVRHRFVTLGWHEAADGGVVAYSVLYRVKGSLRERAVRSERAVHEMNVASLSPDTDYQFSVVAHTAAASSPPSDVIEVRTPAEEAGGEGPRDLRVEDAGAASLTVAWAPPAGAVPSAAADPAQYRVTWVEAEGGGGGGGEQSATVSGTRHTLRGLRAATLYAVRVAAAGAGAGAGSEVRARTLADAPDAPPANVTAAPHSSTSVLVRWTPPPARAHRGPLTGYKVRYRPAGTRRRADSLVTPADARSVELRGLERATAYQIRMCALNANGSGPFSEWVSVTTAPQDSDESRVPPPPGPLRTRAGRDWISVWWTAGEGGADGGEAVRVRNYSLGWGLGVPDERTAVLPDHARNHVVRGLASNSEYVVSLRASNAHGPGPAVYATVRTRAAPAHGDDEAEEDGEADGEGGEGGDDDEDEEDEEEAPALIPPVGLKVMMLSGTTAVVYWTDSTLPKGQPATDGRHYEVQWSAPGGRARVLNASVPSHMISELRPATTYEFAVKLIKGGRSSAWSMVVSNTTLEEAPASPPRDLRLAPAAPAGRAADLSWAPPTRPNGIITGYVIMYSTEARRSDRDWTAAAVLGDRRTARVDRLLPRTTYHFKLQARNSRGLGPFSQPVSFTTPSEEAVGGAGGAGSVWAEGAWLWASAGGAAAVLAGAALLALSVCCRRAPAPLSPDRSTYQKSSASAAIKPPDLWIHHDQMELKQLDKSHHSSSISAGSVDNANALVSSSVTLGRGGGGGGGGGAGGDYEPARLAHAHGSVDRRHYVPTYVDSCGSDDTAVLRAPSAGSGASSLSCRRFDPCDYPPMSSVSGPGGCYPRAPLPRADLTAPLLPSAHHHLPCAMSVCPLGGACGAAGAGGGGDLYAVASRERERGHYVAYEPLGHYTHRDSVSEASGAGSLPRRGAVAGAGGAALHSFTLPSAGSQHSTPGHHAAVGARGAGSCSPYKKTSASGSSASGSPGPLGGPPGRLHGPPAPVSPPLTPSRSTEHLQREMANLEGLMKDLSAISRQQFQC